MVYKDDKKELSKLSIHDVNTKYTRRVYQEAKGVIIGKSTELLELEISSIIVKSTELQSFPSGNLFLVEDLTFRKLYDIL